METKTPTGRVLLKNVRLAFPSLFEPKPFGTDPNSAPRYSATFVLPPDHPQLEEIKAKIEKVAFDKWGKDAAGAMKNIRAKDRVCLHDGDTKSQYEGFAGNLYISAASAGDKAPPTVVNTDRSPLTARSPVPYAGCYVNASIDIYAQDNNFGKGINASLRGVQFLRDGDAFGGSAPARADEFEEVEASEWA